MLLLGVGLIIAAVVLIALGVALVAAKWLLYLGIVLAVIAVVLIVVTRVGSGRNRQL